MPRSSSPRLLALAAIVAVGAWTTFSELDSRSFWCDEACTIFVATQDDPASWIDGLLIEERSPPLYHLLLWPWARMVGTGEAALRAPSALAHVLTILVAWALARRLASERAGLAAAALTAVNPMLVWFALEARPYALLVLLGGLSALLFVRILAPTGESARDDSRHTDSSPPLLRWSVVCSLAIATHYFAVFVVVPQWLWVVATQRRSRRTLVAAALPVLVGLALVPLARAQMELIDFVAGVGWLFRLASIPATMLVGFQPPQPLVTAGLAGLLLPVVLWLLWKRAGAGERRGVAVALLVGVAPIVLAIVASLLPGLDFVLPRYVAGATVPLIVVAAAALGAERAGRTGVVALLAYAALSVFINGTTASVSKFEHEEWRGATAAIGSDDVRRLIVLTPPRELVFHVYRPDAPRLRQATATVDEIVLLALPPVFRKLGQPSRPPTAPDVTPPPGFQFVERTETDDFTLVRFRATEPRLVGRAQAADLALGPERPAVLIEGPR